MIQAATRGKGGEALARHLLRDDENEAVEVLAPRYVVAEAFEDQLREIVARTAHGRTERPIQHLHVDPATEWTEVQYARHLELYEAEFGLMEQPSLAVYHSKHGRGHRHYVWSLVRHDGRVIEMSNDYARREKISRILEFEFGEPHVAGRHNRAVAAALSREGRLDVVQSMEDAGLLDVCRPLAKQRSDRRAQEKRTGICQENLRTILREAWQAAGDAPAFERTISSCGLVLAMGDRVPVLVDETGNVHALARLIGEITTAEGRSWVSAEEVRKRIDGLNLRPLSVVREEIQMVAVFDDLASECVSTSYESLPDDQELLGELAAIIPIVSDMMMGQCPLETGTMIKASVMGMPDDVEDLHAVGMLVDDVATLLAEQKGYVLDVDDIGKVADEMINALPSSAIVLDDEETDHEEIECDGQRAQLESRGSHRTYRRATGEGAGQRHHGGDLEEFLGDASKYQSNCDTDGQDRQASSGYAINAEAARSQNIAGNAESNLVRPSGNDGHDARDLPPSPTTGTVARNHVDSLIGGGQVGSQPRTKSRLEAQLFEARKKLQEAERQIGWLPSLLKRCFNVSIGKQARADSARLEIQQLESKANAEKLNLQKKPTTPKPDLEVAKPDAVTIPAPVDISATPGNAPKGAARASTQAGYQVQTRFSSAVRQSTQPPPEQFNEADDDWPAPNA